MNTIYMDNNATTKVAPEVLESMMPFFKDLYGNPSSMHKFGGQVARNINIARAKIANLIGANPIEIVFTSCGTEGDNFAIRGVLEAYPEKKHIITTKVEHPAVKNTCEYMAKKGYLLTELSVNKEGILDLDELREAIRENTVLVTIMYANNETGVIFPIEEIGKIVKEHNIVFHVDAVQAVGKIPINLKDSTIDILTLSGHKLHAPKGIGAQFIRRGTKIRPFVIGGHQEKGRRGGTENVPYIVGLGTACELAAKNMDKENIYVKKLRDKLESNILENTPNSRLNGHKTNRLPNTTNISFEYVEGEAILLHLDKFGICASSGSACTSGSLEPSHVLRAMGVPFTAAHGSVRFSLSIYNTEEEVNFVVEKVPPIIKELREISPFGKRELKESLKK